MLFWLWSVAVMLSLMAMLIVLPELSFVGDTPSVFHHGGLFLLLLIAFAGFGKWQRLGGQLKTTLFLAFLLASMGVFGWRVYAVHRQYLAYVPKSSVQVVAEVHIKEISDSIYDVERGSAYRQKAVLTNITTDGIVTLPDTMTVLLTAYPTKSKRNLLSPLETLQVGDKAVMTLKLSPLTLEQTTVGFDSTRWLMTRHIHANAQVVAVNEVRASSTPRVQRQREYYRQAFIRGHQADHNQASAVALSLLTGDRALIDSSTKALYQAAGISHLLAISGTHVLFLAILCAGAMSFLVDRYHPKIYYRVPRWQLRWWVMAVIGLCYAWFTGFEVPAVRTVLLLFLLGVARYLLVGASSVRLLMAAAVVMAYVDPYVLWQAGFWLSFVAVALLMVYESRAKALGLGGHLWQLFQLQAYLFVAMLPLTLLLFGKVSLWGLLVNVVAVGLFGWVIVPLNLLGGLLYGLSPTLGSGIWAVVVTLLDGVHESLALLIERFGAGYLGVGVSVASVLLCFLSLFAWRVAFVPTRFALLPLVALLSFYAWSSPAKNQTQLTLLATTQTPIGAVLVQTDGQTYLLLSQMPSRYPPNEAVLSDELWLQLKKAGVARLDGVILQNDSPLLLTVMETLSAQLPTRVLYAPRAGNVGKLAIRTCQAEQALKMGTLEATFVTGWQVGDPSMTTCNVTIRGDLPLSLGGEVVGFDDLPLSANYPITDVLIDATDDDTLWQLYRLLCPKPMAPALVLTHSQSNLDDTTLQAFDHPAVLFVNHLKNPRERKNATDRLLMLTP